MKISREIIINGESQNTEYVLTGIEMERCYNEYVETHDRNEVLHQLKDLDYENWEEIPEEIMADLAEQVRDKMSAMMDDVVLSVIHKNEDKLEEYKEKWKSFYCEVTQSRLRTFYIKAKNEQDAEDLMNKYLEVREDEADDEFRYEEPEYDIGWLRETDLDPDECDVKEEDF